MPTYVNWKVEMFMQSWDLLIYLGNEKSQVLDSES